MKVTNRIKVLLFLLFLFASYFGYSQTNVNITQGTATNICIGGSAVTLSNIVIAEDSPPPAADDDAMGGNADVSGTLIFGIDPDFQFVPST